MISGIRSNDDNRGRWQMLSNRGRQQQQLEDYDAKTGHCDVTVGLALAYDYDYNGSGEYGGGSAVLFYCFFRRI